MPKPREVQHTHDAPAQVSLLNTTITVGVLDDDELETLNRLLKRVGVPDHQCGQGMEAQFLDPIEVRIARTSH